MILKKLIVQHPVTDLLLKSITSFYDKSTFDFLYVSGLSPVLFTKLIDFISENKQEGFVTLARENVELIRYLETSQKERFDRLSHSQLKNLLSNNDYNKVDKVTHIGEYSVIGDTITCWPVGYKNPIKANYWGETLETVFLYDEIYGTKIYEIKEILIGQLSKLETEGTLQQMSINHEKEFGNYVVVFTNDISGKKTKQFFEYDFVYAELFFHRFDILQSVLEKRQAEGYTIYLDTKNKNELPKEILDLVKIESLGLEAGFISHRLKVFYITDRELFGTIFVSKELDKVSSTTARKLLANLEGEIYIGDYIVHEDHGVGLYKGIKQKVKSEKIYKGFGEYITKETVIDYIYIQYASQDELLIPLDQIGKITKYINPQNDKPKLTRLGKVSWENIKKKVKLNIQRIARDLVEHYAKRELATAPDISLDEADSKEYNNFNDKFIYNETPDQLKAEKDILLDVAKTKPMNRLIVGDVGFGKTEVAIRIAFLAVKAGYQVAVLCPTTVLAMQHYKVFTERFKREGIKIQEFSRLSKKHAKENIKKLNTGQIDIAIGTHRILSSDVFFNKLGLLIVDEEQKFGVKQKEKIKKLEYGVHVLSLSATPIPRTLSMALATIQDISIIQTPPEGRRAIKTIVSKIDYQKVADALVKEVKRGGQAYYVHNRVRSLHSTYVKLQKLLPNVRFAIAHGQLAAGELATIIEDFYNKKYDCLLCTTIIENGIDMPNVNTIIIENAQNFGLGQLHQLRGRVGRSKRQAYAYLFYKGIDVHSVDDTLLRESNKNNKDEISDKAKLLKNKKYISRLKAILETDELGAGFRLASRDLEIRGAGSLLGQKQHGNISEIGYGMYMGILAEEIDRLKELMKYVHK